MLHISPNRKFSEFALWVPPGFAMSQSEQYPDGGLHSFGFERSPSWDYDIPKVLHATLCMSGFGIGEYMLSMCLPETVNVTVQGEG